MDEIARRAKVGVGTVYRHFPAKEICSTYSSPAFRELAERATERFAWPRWGAWEAFRNYIEARRRAAADRAPVPGDGQRSERMHARRWLRAW